MADEKPDSILDDVRAAAAEFANDSIGNGGRASGEVGAGDGADAPSSSASETEALGSAAHPRDEAGRFVAKQEGDKPTEKRETLTLKPHDKAAEQPVEAKPAAQPAQEQPKPATEQALSAPLHWKGGQKIQWARLPKDVQQGILDDHKALQDQQAALEPLNRAIEPHREVWMRDAGSVENAIAQLGQFYRAYLDNPFGLIQHIARTRGIDLGQPQGQPPGTPQQAPDLNSIVSQAVQQAIAPINERFAQTESQQYQQTIEAFARDPAHPYFQDVKVHMGHLLKAGQASDMQDAYDQATWANPVIRQALLQQQAEAASKAGAAEAEKAKKAAAASVRGSPLPGAVNGRGNPGASVLDDVRAAAAEHGFGQ